MQENHLHIKKKILNNVETFFKDTKAVKLKQSENNEMFFANIALISLLPHGHFPCVFLRKFVMGVYLLHQR